MQVSYLKWYLLFVLSLVWGCAKEANTEAIINKTIEAHGGKQVWEATEGISFIKETTLYHADGTIESITKEAQSFQIKPDFLVRLEQISDHGHNTINLLYANGQFEMRRAGIKTKMKAPQTFIDKAYGSYFVATQPFHLLKNDATYSLGKDTVIHQKPVYRLQIKYPKGDAWEYYINKQNYRVVANMVQHGSKKSFIVNESFNHSTGLLLHKKRKSYFLNAANEIDYLRASYNYYQYTRQ